MTNPVLAAFAARPETDEPVSDWLYAVEEHIRDQSVWTEFIEDSELRLSVYSTIADLNPSDEEFLEAQRLLRACALVLEDQRSSDVEDMTDGDLLRYVRNIALLPEEPHATDGWRIENDGSDVAKAYITVVAAGNDVFGDNRH